jgi:hypothetical protein
MSGPGDEAIDGGRPAAGPAAPGQAVAGLCAERPEDQPALRRTVPRRSWLEIRWRQFRNAPRPVVRAVLSSLVVAIVLGLVYLAYDVALRHGATLPGGDLRTLYLVLDIAVVLVVGSVVTWLVVPQPRGSGRSTTRSPWSAALGFFAAVPVCYLVLVVVVQILEPLIG